MANPGVPSISPLIRFPNFMEAQSDLNSLSIVVQDLSTVYDVTAVAVLPAYGDVLMPSSWLGPRRYSLLRERDRLKLQRLSLASPFEIVFNVTMGSIGAASTLTAVKVFLDVLSKGTNVVERTQTIAENRALRPERLREAQLRNDILEEGLRRIRARTDLPTEADSQERQISAGNVPDELERRQDRHGRIPASQVADNDFAELLNGPIWRILEYGGGELEISGDEDSTDPEQI